jgi:hypothetical protein
MQEKDDPGLGYALTGALLLVSSLLVVLLLLPSVADVVRGRLLLVAGAPLPALGMLLLLRHVLLVLTALALVIFVFALWQRKSWGFLGINVVAAIALALVIVQVVVLGHHRASVYLILLTLCVGAVLVLSNVPVLRAHVGVRPINQLVEALKWVAAVIVVLASIGLVAAMTVSGASARLRLQPYDALVGELEVARMGNCRWTTQPRVCLPTGYVLRPSGGGAIIERSSSGTAAMAISENAWDGLAAGLGFDSGYELQSVLWGSTYLPLVYATLKQAMYTDGMSVYRLYTDNVTALLQVQPQANSWQVSATIYLSDGTSFELISAHRDKGAAIHPVLVALNAY